MVSKKQIQSKKSFLPIIALVVGGLLLVAGAIYFSIQGSQSDRGTPRLSIDQEVIDYGDVTLDTPVNFTLNVTNDGDGILRFKEEPFIQVVEGC
jgi:hypothetical protein